MAVVKREKRTASEEKERSSLRQKLKDEFGPDGIVEVKPLVTRRKPMVNETSNMTWHDRHRPVATSVPIRIPGAGAPGQGGHPTDKVIELQIWPIAGRTDQFPAAKPYFPRPMDLLEYLVQKEHGHGTIYFLKRVPDELIQIEKDAEMDPVSRKLWGKLQKSYATNEEMVGVSRVTAEAEAEYDRSRGLAVDEEDDPNREPEEDPYTGEPMAIDEEIEEVEA